MKKIDIRQSQHILLGIAKIFDEICTRHHIPYYMIGGTLLGAIRHKGFIPWDDDMDFGVPITYYDKLLKCLASDLKYPYRLCTFDTVKGCGTVFAKIDNCTTCIEDKCQNIPLEDQIGLNIDIFPLCYCTKDDIRNRELQRMRTINRLIFTESTEGQWYKHAVKKILRLFYPYTKKQLLARIWSKTLTISEGPFLANLFGLVGEREFMPIDFYGNGCRYVFEDTTFCGPAEYDKYLTQVYRNYMEIPPIGKRKSHSANVYIK